MDTVMNTNEDVKRALKSEVLLLDPEDPTCDVNRRIEIKETMQEADYIPPLNLQINSGDLDIDYTKYDDTSTKLELLHDELDIKTEAFTKHEAVTMQQSTIDKSTRKSSVQNHSVNSIYNLLNNCSFSSLKLEQKLEIKKLGRPLPDLDIIYKCTTNKKERSRKFNRDIYSKNDWLSGCDVQNKFYCFPCVLFGGDNTWCRAGTNDLAHIWNKIKTHEKSKQHMNNVFSLSILGQTNIRNQLDSAYRQRVARHNEQVDRNRYILKLVVNCIRFCGALELALRGHDETEESTSKGVFGELINFSLELDKELKIHLAKSQVFQGSSKTIQNELLDCMLKVYHQEIANEIKKADYIAIIADETTDVSAECQLVVVLRYIVGDHPVERFWNFTNPEGQDADSISRSILHEINPLIGVTPNKLIAQSYDGASVMSGTLNGVQKIIKNKYPIANYVHCYAHQTKLIMSKAASIHSEARIFFQHLSGLCSFFSTSPQRTRILNEIVQKRLPGSSNTEWNFHSRGVNTVYEHREDLISVMEILERGRELQTTIIQAGGYKLRLQDSEFIFWLTVFHKLMPHVDVIFNQLQKKNRDAVKVKTDMDNFENSVQIVREQIDAIITEIDLEHESEAVKKKPKFNRENRKRQAIEVCDVILQQVKERFTFTGHLVAANLFLMERFTQYVKQFPHDYLNETVEAFPFLEKGRLKSELQVIYARRELRGVSGAVPFFSLLSDNDLKNTFQETLKLLSILITTPMTTSEAERCFNTLKMIKTFLRNTMKDERLNALGMLSTEKVFLNNIANFNEKVIDLFASKEERRMDFVYHST